MNVLKLLGNNIDIKRIKINKQSLQILIKYNSLCKIPKIIELDKNFVEGFAYYIGDGRIRTNKGLSTINSDLKIIKFFINWLNKYFKVRYSNIKINIKTNTSYFSKNLVKNGFIEFMKLDLDKNKIKVFKKLGAKKHHKVLYEIMVYKTVLKSIFDLLLPKVRSLCLKDNKLASAYVRGIMAAEGSPQFNIKKGIRAVRLKMKDKEEIEYINILLKNLNINSDIYYSKSDNEWLISITGVYELLKLHKINIFGLNSERKDRFDYLLSSYKRKQFKKGNVTKEYLIQLSKFIKNNKITTAPKLAEYIGRERTRVIFVLRNLQKKGLVEARRELIRGRPFVFSITEKGNELINNLS